MPCGLKNATSTFQRYMNNIFSNIDRIFISIDDILVFSYNELQHKKDIDTVFHIMHKHNLNISLGKCTFNVSNLDFLGFNLSEERFLPTSNKIKELEVFQAPKHSKNLRRFWGHDWFLSHVNP